jgi:hypothetical protein
VREPIGVMRKEKEYESIKGPFSYGREMRRNNDFE